MENLTLEEYIRIQARRRGVSLSDIARAMDKSPANFLNQLKRGDFRVSELEKIAAALGMVFEYSFKDPDGGGD